MDRKIVAKLGRPVSPGKSLVVARWMAALVGLCLFQAEARVQGQPTGELPAPRKDTSVDPIQLQPPTTAQVFQLETEEMLRKRIRDSFPSGTTNLFPEEPPPSKESYAGRHWGPLVEKVEPAYVCYGRLYFEQINSERYGWDLGIIHPFVSAGVFYFDVLTLPYHMGTEPFRCYECNAGYCLPGDPVPLLLYPPELSWSGAFYEAATIATIFAIFPP